MWRRRLRRDVPGLSVMSNNETCPVCHTAEIISGKWTLLVIRDLADGCSRFCELERSLGGISPRTLSLRLRALEAEGVVQRRTYPEVPPRVEYRLTAKGMALVPLIDQMRHYGQEWLMNGHGATPKGAAVRGEGHGEPIASQPVASGAGAGSKAS
jgi:DNA-binding HxlR family transcriptional regulator